MNMKKTALVFLGVLALACSEKVVEKPENLIPKEKMVEILQDLAVLNAAKQHIKPILEHKEITIMDFLYKKHGIDSTQFVQSDLYYASVPLEYQAIYEKVDAQLERKKAVLEDASKNRNKSKRDTKKKTEELKTSDGNKQD